MVRFVLDYLKKFKGLFLTVILLSLLVAGLQLPMPLLTRYIFDKVVPSANISLLTNLGLLLLCYVVFALLTHISYAYFDTKLKNFVSMTLKLELFGRILRAPLREIEINSPGYLASRIFNEVGDLNALWSDIWSSFLICIISLFVGILACAKLSWRLTIAIVPLVPLSILITRLFSRKIQDSNLKYRESLSNAQKVIVGLIEKILLFKIHANYDFPQKKYEKHLKEVLEADIKRTMINEFATGSGTFLVSIGQIVLIWFGGYEIIMGRLTIGSFFAFNGFMGYIFSSANGLFQNIYKFIGIKAILSRVYEFSEIPLESGGSLIKDIEGDIELKDVSFSYNGNKVIETFNLNVKAGEMVLIEGPNGVGKSTLLKLIAGLYKPSKGSISVDGIEIEEYDLNHYRKKVVLVPQTPMIIDGTLQDNLFMGSENDLTNLQSFIFFGLDKNFEDYYFKNNGSNLSGGEVQRICLMRALSSNPKVLLLDEITSHIDKDGERFVMDALKDLKGKKTIIMVAHKLKDYYEMFDRVVSLK